MASLIVDGDERSYDTASYNVETGEASLSDDATVILVASELPGDTTEFQRDRADGQQLVSRQSVTL